MTARRQGWLSAAALKVESHASANGVALKVWVIFSSAVESFIDNNDLLCASALTYTVALSIVPILALAFSVLKGFGAAEQLTPVLERYLALGSSGTSNQLMHYVENVNAAALGSAGGAFLLLTVISTMGNVEQALNTIFHVPRSRSYLRKFSDYLSVLFTVPLLIAAGLALTTMFSVRILSLSIFTQLTPYLFAWAGFFFLFVFFPYTKVRYPPALIGSLVTAVLFQVAQWGYVRFQVGVAKYQAIYGALATVPIFLVWTYLAWSIILFGAEITASVQRGAERPALRPRSPDFPCAAAMHVLLRLADRQLRGDDGITQTALAHELGVGERALEPILDRLMETGLIIEASPNSRGPASGLFLVRPPASVLLAEALAPFIAGDEGERGDPRVARVMLDISNAQTETLKSMTLADLMSAPAADLSPSPLGRPAIETAK